MGYCNMRKLIAISAVLFILAVLVSSASACIGPGCGTSTGIKVPTASFPSGTFGTYSSGIFAGSVNGDSNAFAAGSCAAESLSATKVTQVGNGGLVESGGVAAASGFPSIATSGSSTEGGAFFGGSGSAIGIAQ
jgi:hypothetical protein